MKKILSVLLLSTFPVLALAAGEHMGGHGSSAAEIHKNMAGMEKEHGSAAGKAGDPSKVSRTIALAMNDTMRFTPSQILVKSGETIRFFIKNSGKIPHEMVIGTTSELKEHAEMMRKMPEMKHAESNMITLAAGQTGGIVWQFDKTGEVDFACLIPGHMEAGMTGKIKVE